MKTTIIIDWQTGEPPRNAILVLLVKCPDKGFGYIADGYTWSRRGVYEDLHNGLELPGEYKPEEVEAWALSPLDNDINLKTGEFVG